MTDKILIGEVEKESVNNIFSDVLFFGNSLIFSNIIEELSSYSNHFEELSLLKTTFSANDDLSHVVDSCAKKGIVSVGIVNNFEDVTTKLLELNSSYLFSNHLYFNINNINCIGFQRQLVETERISNLNSNSYSLGRLNIDIKSMEPELREAEYLLIDLNIISSAYVELNDNKITGLNSEALIQLIKYSAHSPNIKSIFFKTNNIEQQGVKKASELIATCIWYFLEGLRQGHYISDETDEKYFVTIDELEEPLLFLYSNKFDKWWLQLEGGSKMMACSHAEYEQAVDGDLPDRLLNKIIEL